MNNTALRSVLLGVVIWFGGVVAAAIDIYVFDHFETKGSRGWNLQVTMYGIVLLALAEAELRALVEKFAPAHARLIGALRRWVLKRLPTAHEVVYEYRSWIVISYSPSEHGYEGVLAIRADADGVKLYFNQGKGLPDPEKLLRGSAQARWVAVESASTLARAAVASLAGEAIARNSVPFAASGRGPIVLRPASAK